MLSSMVAVAVALGAGLTHCSPVPATASPSPSPSPSPKPAALWQPPVNATWQIELYAPLNLPTTASTLTPAASIYDFDMFDNTNKTIATVHRLGAKVICYFSAGSYEPWRPDATSFKASDKGSAMDGWPDEAWLDIRSANVRAIMAKRIQLAAQKGCDAIDPDNVDGYQNDNGLGLTQADTVSFVRFLASTAAGYGLSTGLKNAGEVIPKVLDVVQFAVNEQCAAYSECATWQPFVKAGKPVLRIEYPSGAPKVTATKRQSLCAAKGSTGFSTVLKKMSLDGWVMFCNGTTATTPTMTS